jgi:hypothetical protein
VLKKRPDNDEDLERYLTDVGHCKAIVPFLDKAECKYTVQPSSNIKNFLFRTTRIDSKELEVEVRQHGLRDKINRLVKPLTLSQRIKPIMPLRQGHLA